MAVRISVDLNKCESYAQCCFLAPDVFLLRGREMLLHHPEVDEAQRSKVLRAAAACPVQAIVVESASLTAELLAQDSAS